MSKVPEIREECFGLFSDWSYFFLKTANSTINLIVSPDRLTNYFNSVHIRVQDRPHYWKI